MRQIEYDEVQKKYEILLKRLNNKTENLKKTKNKLGIVKSNNLNLKKIIVILIKKKEDR